MSFFRFCMRYPEDCKVRGVQSGEEPVTLTKERKAELAKVNRDVNRAITPHENDNGVMEEEWLVAPREGDCHDYAVTKRHELLARGWPSSSLLLAEVVVASGEHHLVLVVRTREEDVVLDNLNWNVRPVSQIHYQWVRAQQAGNPKFWSTDQCGACCTCRNECAVVPARFDFKLCGSCSAQSRCQLSLQQSTRPVC